MSSILQNINSFLPQAQKMLPEVQKLFKYVMGEAGEIINFVNYDKGLPYKNDDYKTYEDRCEACNDITVGVLDQGMFQMTQLDSKRYKEIQDFLDKHKNNIAEINFFMLSESLEDGANPLLDIMPVMNIYHTAIGITFVDKNGKIIRSMVLQLNFGPLDGIDDAFTRFLCPQFCMNMVKDPNTGNAKNPLTFTNEEFATNLFIDYSKSISSLLVSFNESADYVTEELIKTMACVDVANLTTAAPEPYKQFINQNITDQIDMSGAAKYLRDDLDEMNNSINPTDKDIKDDDLEKTITEQHKNFEVKKTNKKIAKKNQGENIKKYQPDDEGPEEEFIMPLIKFD